MKLLRALQERKVKAVGGNEELEVGVRVIAATNRDLEAEVARNAFRADLFYRLNVVETRRCPRATPAKRRSRERGAAMPPWRCIAYASSAAP